MSLPIIIALSILAIILGLMGLALYACYLADRIDQACQEFNRDHL